MDKYHWSWNHIHSIWCSLGSGNESYLLLFRDTAVYDDEKDAHKFKLAIHLTEWHVNLGNSGESKSRYESIIKSLLDKLHLFKWLGDRSSLGSTKDTKG